DRAGSRVAARGGRPPWARQRGAVRRCLRELSSGGMSRDVSTGGSVDAAGREAKRVAVVVGVGAGLGTALARRFACDYAVALVARSRDVTGPLADEIGGGGGVALPIQSDATVPDDVAAAYEMIHRKLGPPEVLVFNGGRRPFGTLLDTTPEVFEETWRLHAFGAFLWARQVVPDMLRRRSGTILITGATAGVKPGASSAPFRPPQFPVRR